jgi:hypothetical protein
VLWKTSLVPGRRAKNKIGLGAADGEEDDREAVREAAARRKGSKVARALERGRGVRVAALPRNRAKLSVPTISIRWTIRSTTKTMIQAAFCPIHLNWTKKMKAVREAHLRAAFRRGRKRSA